VTVTLSSGGMTHEPETADSDEKEGFTRRARAGAWEVTAWWPIGARGGPHELRIVPARDADPVTVARGISTATLSAIPLTDMTAEYAELAPSIDQAAGWVSSLQQEADRKRNRSASFYALTAAEYVALIEAGEHQPVQVIAKRTGKSGEAVRGWIRTARNLGFLTGEAGRTTGELTEEAKRLLSEAPFKPDEGDKEGK
jgi:hypothetical protein